LWVSANALSGQLPAGGEYLYRIDEASLEKGACRLKDSNRLLIQQPGGAQLSDYRISDAVEVFYENFDPAKLKNEGLQVEDWEVYLQYETDNWLKYVSQHWEFEVLRRPGGFYLVTNCAGHPWSLYPLVRHFAAGIGKSDCDIIILLDVLEGMPLSKENEDDYIGMFFTKNGKPDYDERSVDGLMDECLKTGNPVRLVFESEQRRLLSEAVIAAKATVLIGLLNEGDLM
jgi:hypothetical protein